MFERGTQDRRSLFGRCSRLPCGRLIQVTAAVSEGAVGLKSKLSGKELLLVGICRGSLHRLITEWGLHLLGVRAVEDLLRILLFDVASALRLVVRRLLQVVGFVVPPFL